jgi:hypothetical protein
VTAATHDADEPRRRSERAGELIRDTRGVVVGEHHAGVGIQLEPVERLGYRGRDPVGTRDALGSVLDEDGSEPQAAAEPDELATDVGRRYDRERGGAAMGLEVHLDVAVLVVIRAHLRLTGREDLRGVADGGLVELRTPECPSHGPIGYHLHGVADPAGR